ncbi:hypothetical protein PILCRDRAFT_821369 [Piloderma croceum F 1598]|uniref:Uncharacterized protein n=1 Tax=Piloderma croceum (strain F 1598) TaxID=765440 RepID=A0A0C3FR38_PILCF|nr:hypothetical protein PILCRDRAFT_821369 [Piloderma croceum F 1598]
MDGLRTRSLKTSVAIGTENSRLFVIWIPPTIFTTTDTRVAEATGWRAYLKLAWEDEPFQVDRDRDDDVSQLPGDR